MGGYVGTLLVSWYIGNCWTCCCLYYRPITFVAGIAGLVAVHCCERALDLEWRNHRTVVIAGSDALVPHFGGIWRCLVWQALGIGAAFAVGWIGITFYG